MNENKQIKFDLNQNEKLLWEGSPRSDMATFGLNDLKFILAGLFGITVILLIMRNIYSQTGFVRMDWMLILFAAFLAFYAYQILFMFFTNIIINKKTRYFLTNKRVVCANYINHKIKYEYLEKIDAVDIVISPNDYISLHFGKLNYYDKSFRNTGLRFFSKFYGEKTISFFLIKSSITIFKVLKKNKIKQFNYNSSDYRGIY